MTTLSGSIPNDTPIADTSRSAESVRCVHCDLPVPPGLRQADPSRPFCCDGCATVWRMIHEHGLDAYYDLRDAAESAVPSTTGRGYEEYDDDVFTGRYVQQRDDGTCSTELLLEGVHCAACVWLVEKLSRLVPGVTESRLSIRDGVARVSWNAGATSLSAIAQTLDRLGYPPHPARGVDRRHVRQREDRAALIRIAVAGACAGNAMLVSIALYAGDFSGMDAATRGTLRWVGMALGVLTLAWPGAVFFRGAWSALRSGTTRLDQPIALALGVGGVAGVLNTAMGRPEVYFDSLAVLVLLLLVGRFIQQRQHARAADALDLLLSLWPGACQRVEADGQVRRVAVESLACGDVVEVLAGESFAVDGRVTSGQSVVDQSLLTGESAPVSVSPGDRVYAGTTNLGSSVRVSVEKAGAATRAGQLMKLVEKATRERAPIVQWADRVSGWFVVAALLGAAVTFLGWLPIDPFGATDHAVALLIVACPCALGLATPLVIAVALGRAAQRHILVTDGGAIQRLARPGVVLLDKTGTITTGRVREVRWVGDESIRPLVAALESRSSHPIARALAGDADDRGDGFDVVDARQEQHGISGVIDGRRVDVGNERFARSRGVAPPDWATRAIDACADDGVSAILACVDGDVRAVIGVGDALRPDSVAAVDGMRRRGWDVRILSGDHPSVVETVARRLGIDAADARGGLTPEQKQQIVKEQMAEADRPVVMVGDGVNDAAALGSASVGIAVHGVAEAGLAAAHVYLARPGLSPIVELVDAAGGTDRALRRNLAVSVGYNVFAVALAGLGYITPLVAAVLMPISSFTVLTIALGHRSFRGGAT